MRKKSNSASTTVHRTARNKQTAQAKKGARCAVCGGDVAPFSIEELCWVCRRLKISAWRDVENQAGMQE